MASEKTRQRIVAAIRELHEERGPAATTISAIAERAGVQRLTVYRHFPEEGELIGACSADWSEDHPLPDAALWSGVRDPAERLRAALSALYGYFRGGAPMLERILRDEDRVPALGRVMRSWWAYMREVAGSLAAGWGVDAGRQRRVRAVVGHALRFETWQSLTGEGLSDDEAAELMVMLMEATIGSSIPTND